MVTTTSPMAVLLALVVVSSSLLASNSVIGLSFQVGGRDGWVINPSESYDHWARRLRFQVNDTLVFKYKQGSDSVLQVNREDYLSCNISKPLKMLDSGSDVFQFDRSGPFYFISGNKVDCINGKKLVTVILAVRPPPPPSTPRTPVTPLPPPSVSPALTPNSPASPSPISVPPHLAPRPSAAVSPSPTSVTPSLAPQPSDASSPSPASSLAPERSPTSTSPAVSPGSSGGGGRDASPESGGPGAADQTSPSGSNGAPAKSSAGIESPAALVVVGIAGLVSFFM